MRRLYRYLPPFAGDYSGVGSALYELGGMLCIHDASGCTGNYVGFDEPRSYDSKQLVYCTGLRKNDAILGNEEVYIEKIVKAAEDMKPKFIALVGSPVPLIIGFDFNGVAMELEHRLGIPAFGFDTGGMKGSYKDGVAMAVKKLLDYYVLPRKEELQKNVNQQGAGDMSQCMNQQDAGDMNQYAKSQTMDRIRGRVNIVGATPLDLSSENLQAFRELLETQGYEVVSILAMENEMDQLLKFYQADVNLAITQAGALIALDLEKKYGIPYLAGLPIGEYGSSHYFECLEQVFETKASMEVSQKPVAVHQKKKGRAVVLEDGIIASSIRTELLAEGYQQVDVISLFERDPGMAGIDASYAQDEDGILEAVNTEGCELLVADPILLKYREKKDGVKLVELPKYAISSKLMHHRRWTYVGEGWNQKPQYS